MAKWIIKNKQWSIINGLEQELLANEIGTAIFRELYKNAKTKDENTKQKIINFYKNKIEPIAPFAIELLIRFILDL